MADVEELCDRVGFLVAGEMSVVDAPAALKARYGERRVRVEYEDDGGTPGAADFALDGLGRDGAFLELLNARPIRSLHSQEASLNRVFADVTGVQLTHEPVEPVGPGEGA